MLAAVLVLLLWLIALFTIPKIYGAPGNPGVFGDMFGALNALFTGVALAGVIATTWMQRILLHEQLEAGKEAERRHAEQMAIAKSQLELAQQELLMERQRAVREAEPLILFTERRTRPDYQEYQMENRGGPIKEIEVSSGWAQISIHPTQYFARDAAGFATFTGPANPTEFTLRYVRLNDGVACEDTYTLSLTERKIRRKGSRII